MKSTAGWGSSSKQGSDAGRPNPNTAKSESYDDEGYNFADEEESHSRRNAGSRVTARTRPAAAKFEVDDDDEYAAFADRRDEEEDQPRRVARFRGPGASLKEPKRERESQGQSGSSSGIGGHP